MMFLFVLTNSRNNQTIGHVGYDCSLIRHSSSWEVSQIEHSNVFRTIISNNHGLEVENRRSQFQYNRAIVSTVVPL